MSSSVYNLWIVTRVTAPYQPPASLRQELELPKNLKKAIRKLKKTVFVNEFERDKIKTKWGKQNINIIIAKGFWPADGESTKVTYATMWDGRGKQKHKMSRFLAYVYLNPLTPKTIQIVWYYVKDGRPKAETLTYKHTDFISMIEEPTLPPEILTESQFIQQACIISSHTD